MNHPLSPKLNTLKPYKQTKQSDNTETGKGMELYLAIEFGDYEIGLSRKETRKQSYNKDE